MTDWTKRSGSDGSLLIASRKFAGGVQSGYRSRTSQAGMSAVWKTAVMRSDWSRRRAMSSMGIAVNENAELLPIGVSAMNRHAVPHTARSR